MLFLVSQIYFLSFPYPPALSYALLLLSHFSCVRLCATPSLRFSRQEHWSGLPFPSPMHKSEKWKWSCSVVSDSLWPHGLQPTRLLLPWDFPGKSTGVGCHCFLHWAMHKWCITEVFHLEYPTDEPSHEYNCRINWTFSFHYIFFKSFKHCSH